MNSLVNPYRPLPNEPDEIAPFAGRREAFARLHQYLQDTSADTLVFTGWPKVGKTAFLQQFDHVYDDSLIGVYIPLAEHSITSNDDLLRVLVDATVKTLGGRDFTLTRVPETPLDVDDWQQWVVNTWLPAIKAAVRQHRTLVWLLDDAQHIRAIKWETLIPPQPRVKLVLTLDIEYESSLLGKPAQIIRLMNLSAPETSDLLCEPVSEVYTLTSEALAEAYRITGGQPQWAQRLGFHIFRQHRASVVEAAEVKALLPTVYVQSQDELDTLWHRLTDNERLVLSAISNLLYIDPLRTLHNAAIAGWLVETDYPLDETAVHATIRSLEYRELLAFAGRDLSEIRLTSGLLQRWLVENARPSTSQLKLAAGTSLNRRTWAIIGAILVLIAAVLVAISQNPQRAENDLPLPTVTLVSQP